MLMFAYRQSTSIPALWIRSSTRCAHCEHTPRRFRNHRQTQSQNSNILIRVAQGDFHMLKCRQTCPVKTPSSCSQVRGDLSESTGSQNWPPSRHAKMIHPTHRLRDPSEHPTTVPSIDGRWGAPPGPVVRCETGTASKQLADGGKTKSRESSARAVSLAELAGLDVNC